MRLLCLGIAGLLTVSACATGDQTADATPQTTTTAEDRARGAALTANAVAANPASADSIVRAAGHTQDSFQKLMYEIAADSEMSAAYTSVKAR